MALAFSRGVMAADTRVIGLAVHNMVSDVFVSVMTTFGLPSGLPGSGWHGVTTLQTTVMSLQTFHIQARSPEQYLCLYFLAPC